MILYFALYQWQNESRKGEQGRKRRELGLGLGLGERKLKKRLIYKGEKPKILNISHTAVFHTFQEASSMKSGVPSTRQVSTLAPLEDVS